MKKVLLISDVHRNIELMKDILSKNLDVDYRIYLGDFEVSLSEQEEYTKLFDWSVLGNRDIDTGEELIKFVEIEGLKIMLVHGHAFQTMKQSIDFNALYSYAEKEEAELILHGHDHIRANEVKNGITRFNPGSTTIPLDGKAPSYAILEINHCCDFKLTWIEL